MHKDIPYKYIIQRVYAIHICAIWRRVTLARLDVYRIRTKEP